VRAVDLRIILPDEREAMWRVIGTGLSALLLSAFATAPGFAASSQNARIGQVKTVSGDAVVIRSGARLPAKIGDPVYRSDVIETGAAGTIGLTLIDNSVFSTGPGSQLALQEFRFDPAATGNAMLADLRKGTLSIVTGDLPHSGPEAMRIKTPTTILGIRGTTFAIEVH
jgi:hypothetical protein